MWDKANALKEWADNADERVFWLGFITGVIMTIFFQLLF